MNPYALRELAQIAEQEHMQDALRRRALREARQERGEGWAQILRAWLHLPQHPRSEAQSVPASAAAPRPQLQVVGASRDMECAAEC